jgi:hypothetical protein
MQKIYIKFKFNMLFLCLEDLRFNYHVYGTHKLLYIYLTKFYLTKSLFYIYAFLNFSESHL